MSGDYSSLTKFVRETIVEPRLEFNHLKTTKSAINSIINEFQKLGWTTEHVENTKSKVPKHRIISKDGSIILSMSSAKVFRHPMYTEQICQRKHLTKRMLAFEKLPIPAGSDFSPTEKNIARAFFGKIPKPVVIKPTNSGGSHGVTVGVLTIEDFESAWNFAIDEGGSNSSVLIEEFVRGIELRVLVIGDQVVSIVARIQPFVVGDGKSELSFLIKEAENARKVHYRAMQLPVVIDWNFVSKRGYSSESVPKEGDIVFLNPLSLLANGAFYVDITDSVCGPIKSMAVNARKAIPGLEVGGIDILVEDINDVTTAVILEVNTAPSLNIHRYATHGQPRAVDLDIVEYFHAQSLSSVLTK
ncbi:hypothetical protein [Glutamicibacter uratoxydans]|uniref:hypothetical protein n=1 Tax=Glutamicibacter uratoxydans TaxID=43667 RepID=UPI003D6F8D2E